MLPALFAAREQRVRPGLDDKVLLGWNALFLRSLTEAADALGRADWMDAARTNARFLLAELRRDDGRLLRSWQDGRANLLAYAEDYAALLEALLTLAELDDVEWLAEARTVADDLVALFADDERGGFFTTGADAEALIVRPKDYQDNATPSENSLAADGLLRLAALTGDAAAADRAERWLATLAPVLGEHPTAFAFLLEALQRGRAAAARGRRGGRRRRSGAGGTGRRAARPHDSGLGPCRRRAGSGGRPHAAAGRTVDRRRPRRGLRVRALRVPAPRHRPRRAPRPARSRAHGSHATDPVASTSNVAEWANVSCGGWRDRRRGPRPSPSRRR